MNSSTEDLLQQYFDDRLALARLNVLQRFEDFLDTNLTVHELRIVLTIASGAATTKERLVSLIPVAAENIDAALGRLVQFGYVEPVIPAGNLLSPTEAAMDLLDAAADRRDTTMELLADLDPHDLAALVKGTHALRQAMEADAQTEGGLFPGDTLGKLRSA